jgi:hypothetical protein
MASKNKKQKTDKKSHPGRGGSFLKSGTKLKGTAFYNSSDRQKNKKISDND